MFKAETSTDDRGRTRALNGSNTLTYFGRPCRRAIDSQIDSFGLSIDRVASLQNEKYLLIPSFQVEDDLQRIHDASNQDELIHFYKQYGKDIVDLSQHAQRRQQVTNSDVSCR